MTTRDDIIDELEARCDYVATIVADRASAPSEVRQAVGFVLVADDGSTLSVEIGIDADQRTYAVARWFDETGEVVQPTLLDAGDSILLQPT